MLAGAGGYWRVLAGVAGAGGYWRVLAGAGGYWRVLAGTGGYWRVLAGTGGFSTAGRSCRRRALARSAAQPTARHVRPAAHRTVWRWCLCCIVYVVGCIVFIACCMLHALHCTALRMLHCSHASPALRSHARRRRCALPPSAQRCAGAAHPTRHTPAMVQATDAMQHAPCNI